MHEISAHGRRVVGARELHRTRQLLAEEREHAHDPGLAGGAEAPQDGTPHEDGARPEAERDERVLSASATVTFADDVLTIELSLTLAEGTFSLVLAVSAVSASLLLAA